MGNYENKDICSACGGACCKHLPGIAAPADFNMPDKARISEALRSGLWALDCYEGQKSDYTDLWYLRPATKHAQGQMIDRSWGGVCVFFEEATGCTLPHDDRPEECRLLEPVANGPCVPHGGDKFAAGEAWAPYNIYEIAIDLGAIDDPPGFLDEIMHGLSMASWVE